MPVIALSPMKKHKSKDSLQSHSTKSKEEDRIKKIQSQLTLVQQAYMNSKESAVIVLEGVDAAGKGGLIRRMAWAMDPRALQVWPIGAPNEIEKNSHYMKRFWEKLPLRGAIAVFDRSWYGRVLVERIEGFASSAEWNRAYKEINAFEESLVDNGVRVIKILLEINEEEQAKRFKERIENPKKQWKLTFEDFRNRKNWKDYLKAYSDMIENTSTPKCPWKRIDSNNKSLGRVAALEYIYARLSKGVDLKPPPVSKKLKELAKSL
jgi:polyphosphate kinase 2 (PPK2 family)